MENKSFAAEWKTPEESANEYWNGLRRVHTSLLVNLLVSYKNITLECKNWPPMGSITLTR